MYELDFDSEEISITDPADGWRSYSMKDVSSAVYHAFRKCFLPPEQYERRFMDKLADQEITSAGHLSAKDISLAEEIYEMDDHLLNFYIEVNFDVDAIFGTHVVRQKTMTR